jgi:glycosidase
MHHHPVVYEANACLLLRRLSDQYERSLTLATIPEDEWHSFKRRGFDIVWLMGVWQRSPGARQRALLEPSLRKEYDHALPGWTDNDVAGSPFAVYGYNLDPTLGTTTDLAKLKYGLNQQGLALLLDFVPNHLALDHPWTFSHPQWFVRGKDADIHLHPDWFYSPDGQIYLAHGRDPNFPPWTDTAQLNLCSMELRQALISELLQIAEVADGVRCDMAMLALNNVFENVWGEVIGDYSKPETEFWADAIGAVRKLHPDFIFLAEAYWGLERKLQGMGFDFTYDKVLYERLRFSSPSDIREYLIVDGAYQRHSAHFIENHDEERAVSAFGRSRSLAAAVILTTVPGLRLFHDGQFEGRRIRLPIQLMREPEEPSDGEIENFYERLLAVCNSPAFHEGEWGMLEVSQVEGSNQRHHNLLAWQWRHPKQLKIVVVNYSPQSAKGWLRLPLLASIMKRIVVFDQLTGETYTQNVNQLGSHGLFLDLNAWQAQILDMVTDLPS